MTMKLPPEWEKIVDDCLVDCGPRCCVERCYQLHTKPRKELTDAEICKVADSMPQGFDGFWKTWGYRQFARAVIDADRAKQSEPERVKFRAARHPDGSVHMFIYSGQHIAPFEWLEPEQSFEVTLP